MSDKLLVLEAEKLDAIRSSVSQFDLEAPLTDEEVQMMGHTGSIPDREKDAPQSFKPAQDIEEPGFVESTTQVASELDYNSQYAYYLKCQSVITLISFEEGWESFQQFVLKPFLNIQRQENKEYRGTNPNDAFALRLREQTAEDYLVFINAVIEDLKSVPKPVLKQQS